MDNKILLPLFQAWSSWWEREAEGVGERWRLKRRCQSAAQVLCGEKGEGGRSCSLSKGVYGSEGACVP